MNTTETEVKHTPGLACKAAIKALDGVHSWQDETIARELLNKAITKAATPKKEKRLYRLPSGAPWQD